MLFKILTKNTLENQRDDDVNVDRPSNVKQDYRRRYREMLSACVLTQKEKSEKRMDDDVVEMVNHELN